jgi:phospholipid/cholesterol/gamma-HCH transport system substrate-binding protein
MEREANYVAVGAFVLLVLAMAALFVYWYSDARDQRTFNRYEVYFDGSVSGLAVGGQVRYLGVDVGRVVRIKLDQRAADRVQVIVDIDASAPISERTLAQLSLQGVTGLLFIDLFQQHAGALPERLMDPVSSERYPVIRSVRSNFDLFLSGLPQVAGQIGELATRGNKLLGNENLAAVKRLLDNLDRASAELPKSGHEVAQLITELRAATAASRSAIDQINAAMTTAGPDLASTLARMRVAADHLASASEQLDGLLTEDRGALHGFVQQSLPQVDALLRESREAAREFGQLSKSLREDPAQLLYQPPSAAVEIPK